MSQDFSHQNLQGRSFKGQDLTGANFSHADIRGANFSNAVLKGASFNYATAGLPRLQADTNADTNTFHLSRLLPASFFFPSVFLFLMFSTPKTFQLFNPKIISTYTIFPGLFIVLLMAIFLIIILSKGLEVFSIEGILSICTVQIGAITLSEDNIKFGGAFIKFLIVTIIVFWLGYFLRRRPSIKVLAAIVIGLEVLSMLTLFALGGWNLLETVGKFIQYSLGIILLALAGLIVGWMALFHRHKHWAKFLSAISTGTGIFAITLAVAVTGNINSADDLAYPAMSCLLGVLVVTASVISSAILARCIAGFRAGVLALGIFVVITIAIARLLYFQAYFHFSKSFFAANISSAIVLAIGLLATYVGWRALLADEQFTKFGNFSLTTTFGGADLTDADFTGAKLQHTNFRKAILNGTCWQDAKNLDRAIFDRSVPN